MTAETIHTCSYYCERPGCIRAQRDELRDRMESALAKQPASIGEEIMVNTAHDVFILPLQPSGLSSGPRFVVHVPPEQPAAEAQGTGREIERQNADASVDVEAVLRWFLTGDGYIAECDISHIVAALARVQGGAK